MSSIQPGHPSITAKSGRVLLGSELGQGREGCVVALENDAARAAKLFHEPTAERLEKLAVMLRIRPEEPYPNYRLTAWPDELLYQDGHVIGYLMPRVAEAEVGLVYLNPYLRASANLHFDERFLLACASNLAQAVRIVHACGHCINDLHPQNILFSRNDARPTLIDCDSFHIVDPATGRAFSSRMGFAGYTARENLERGPRADPECQDRFALAVMLYQLLMEGLHPFDNISWEGDDDPPDVDGKIRSGYWAYTRSQPFPGGPPPDAPPFEFLPASVQALFTQCFDAGHEDPWSRPSSLDWVRILQNVYRSRYRETGQHATPAVEVCFPTVHDGSSQSTEPPAPGNARGGTRLWCPNSLSSPQAPPLIADVNGTTLTSSSTHPSDTSGHTTDRVKPGSVPGSQPPLSGGTRIDAPATRTGTRKTTPTRRKTLPDDGVQWRRHRRPVAAIALAVAAIGAVWGLLPRGATILPPAPSAIDDGMQARRLLAREQTDGARRALLRLDRQIGYWRQHPPDQRDVEAIKRQIRSETKEIAENAASVISLQRKSPVGRDPALDSLIAEAYSLRIGALRMGGSYADARRAAKEGFARFGNNGRIHNEVAKLNASLKRRDRSGQRDP